jgi:hypothetical protein
VKTYKKYYKVIFPDKVEIRELKSDLPFSIEEGKGHIKYNSPNATNIKQISLKEVERIKKENEKTI